MLAGRKVANEYAKIAQSVVADESKSPPPKTLLEYECSTYESVLAKLKSHAPNLVMLGCTESKDNSSPSCVGRHLPIFSFLIRCGKRFLHYNYVCAILNDVFGIQSRGGCQCAGPYSQRLLGLTTLEQSIEIPNEANRQVERALLRSDRPCELLRPGYTRLSLPFKGLRDEEVDYVTQGLIWVAKNGWMLLPQYRCDHRTGEWRHWSRRGKPLGKSERRWLSHYDILSPAKQTGNAACGAEDFVEIVKAGRARLDQAMENANAILEAAKHDPRFLAEVEKMNSADGMLGSGGNNDVGEGGIDHTLEDLRWYVYQQEVSQYLRDGLQEVPETFVDDSLLGALDVRMDGKRIKSISGGSARMDLPKPAVSNNTPIVQETPSQPMESDTYQFQDGEHAGEAPYEEIKAGFEDGELSEVCEVFSKAKDDWVPIEDFLKDYQAGSESGGDSNGKKRNLSAMEEDSPSERINAMKIESPGPDDADVPPPEKQASVDLPATLTKREKKKPSRDSSQWGQCSAPHIASSTCAPTTKENEKTAEKETDSNGTKFTATSEGEAAQSAGKMSNKQKKNKGKLKPPPKMMRFITQVRFGYHLLYCLPCSVQLTCVYYEFNAK